MRLITDIVRVLRDATCRSGTRSRSAAITSARPAATPCRRSRSRSPTASPTSRPRVDAGLDVDEFAPRLSFFFNVAQQLPRGGREVPRRAPACGRGSCASASARRTRRAQMLRFHTPDRRRRRCTAQQPLDNVVRVDDAGARRGARRHAVAAHEQLRRGARRCRPRRPRASRCARSRSSRTRSGVADFVDPLGGSVRRRGAHRRDRERARRRTSTRSTSWAAWSRAIEQGYPQREIERRAYEHQRAVETKRAHRRRRQRVRAGRRGRRCRSRRSIPQLERDQVARVRGAARARNAAEHARALHGARRRRRGHRRTSCRRSSAR